MSFDVLRTMLKSWLARYRVPERTHALWQVPRTWLRSHGWAPQTLVGRMLLLLLVGVVAIYMIAVGGLWWTGGKIITDSLRKQAVQWLAELDTAGLAPGDHELELRLVDRQSRRQVLTTATAVRIES